MNKKNMKFIDIGNRLKLARKSICDTLKNMSEISGFPISTISEMEAARNKPNTEYLIFLADRFHVNLNWIFTGKGAMFLPGFELKFDFGKDTDKILEMIYMLENCDVVRLDIFKHYLEIRDRYADSLKNYLPPGKKDR